MLLYGGLCLAFAAVGCFCEALQFYCQHSRFIADVLLKEALLRAWLRDASTPLPGDLVQLGGEELGIALQRAEDFGCWQVRISGTAINSVDDKAVIAEIESHEIRNVHEADMTLLSLRLSDEQRERWRSMMDMEPSFLEDRMSSGNEARWRRLFSAARRLEGSTGGDEDYGLPLEQTFMATLYGMILDHQSCYGEQAEFWIDVLGCRSALELAEEPLGRLKRLMKVLPRCQRLVVRGWAKIHGVEEVVVVGLGAKDDWVFPI
eukprot:symbB.v1.2.033312.t1/scaffold4120.1/size95231/2